MIIKALILFTKIMGNAAPICNLYIEDLLEHPKQLITASNERTTEGSTTAGVNEPLLSTVSKLTDEKDQAVCENCHKPVGQHQHKDYKKEQKSTTICSLTQDYLADVSDGSRKVLRGEIVRKSASTGEVYNRSEFLNCIVCNKPVDQHPLKKT
jgi:hypothetical protein